MPAARGRPGPCRAAGLSAAERIERATARRRVANQLRVAVPPRQVLADRADLAGLTAAERIERAAAAPG